HLADEAGLERRGLELDDDVAAQLQVIEQQVDVEVVVAELEVHLPAHEGEAAAEFEQEALDVVDQGLLDLALAARVGGAEEVEQVRILEDLRGHVRVGRGQGVLEVVERLALALVGAAVDLELQDAAAPAVL